MRSPLTMTDVPIISITQDENVTSDHEDGASPRPNINECHTDVEDLDSEQDSSRKNSLVCGLKKSMKCNGSVTDVEDYADSDDNEEPEPEASFAGEFSLNEFLDQGTVDESSNLMGNEKKKLIAMHSVAKSPSPTAFHLIVAEDLGGVTDCEDMEDSGDDDEDENEKVYSEDEQPIILEGSNAVDIHDTVSKWKRLAKFATRAVDPTSSITSSESEDEKPKTRLKTQKHFTKRGHKIEDAKSDIESMLFSDEERRKSMTKPQLMLETPDIEVMAFEGSDAEDINEEPLFPEINITFAADASKPKKKSKYRSTPAPSPMLALPDNQDEGHTDVENLDSSDDDEEHAVKAKPKHCIPIAVIKSDALTDVEDFDSGSDDDCTLDEKPDVPLPSPVREFTILIENKSGEPTKSTTPLPDSMLLGFHDLDADKGLTDVEDFSDESGAECEVPDYNIESIPDLDGGFVESSDHTTVKGTSLAISGATPEPITDTEDMFMKQNKSQECRRRRTKPKHAQQQRPKGLFLDTKLYADDEAGGAHTDVEDLNLDDDDVLLKDKNIKQRRSTAPAETSRTSSNGNIFDGKTDVEDMSGDEGLDLLRYTPELQLPIELDSCYLTRSRDTCGSKRNSVHFLELNLPEIRQISPTPEPYQGSTDVEDLGCISETDDCALSYSRAQTATPMELKRNLEELCTSDVHEIHSGAFDKDKEHHEMKENLCLGDSQTDIENFDDDAPAN